MRTRAFSLTAAAALIAAALSSFSCAPGGVERGGEIRFVIGVSQANLFEPWRVAMTREIQTAAGERPDVRVVVSDAADRADRQIDDVNRLVACGIDLLIISPVDSRELTPTVSRLYGEIPVIVLDRGIEGYDYTVYVGPDNTKLGEDAGALMRDLLGPEGGKILELRGRTGSPPADARSAGFRTALARVPAIELVDSIDADWLRDRSEDLLSARLPGYPPLDAVFAQNDAMALGARRALDRAGRKETLVIGVDGLDGPSGGLELVREGILAATFVSPTGGREAVAAALDILNREGGIPKKIILRSRRVTTSDLAGKDAPVGPALARPGRGSGITLGFAQPGRESDWRLANIASIREAARKAGIDLKMVNAELDQGRQIAAIRSFIAGGVDVIAFSPIVEDGWDEVLAEARDAGIPVICSDRTVTTEDDTLVSTYIGADFLEEGRRAARWLLADSPEGFHFRILEIPGTPNSAPANGRRDGFREIMETLGDCRIETAESGNFSRSGGRASMERWLAKAETLPNVVWAHNDDMALGAIEAIESAGLVPGKDLRVVSVDGVRDAFRAMIAGKLACSVECSPLLGPQLMKAVRDYMDGRDLPLRIITEEGVFSAENAAAEIARRRY